MREREAKQFNKTALGLLGMGYELRDKVGDQELFEEVLEMVAELDRRAADVLGQRAYRVVLEHEPVYAFTAEEAVENCLGNETTSERHVEELVGDA